jgi:hypothetical protein
MVTLKPLDLPPEVARRFVRDMNTFFTEENGPQARPAGK